VARTRARSIAAVAGRVLLGLVVAILVAGAVLAILAYYADMAFDVEAVVIAVVAAGVLVYLWTRWR